MIAGMARGICHINRLVRAPLRIFYRHGHNHGDAGPFPIKTCLRSRGDSANQSAMTPSVICIGSALWDVIGTTDRPMKPGHDVPGQIERRTGGVALNVALAISERGLRPSLLSAIGWDPAGKELIDAIEDRDVDCSHVTRTCRPTDIYMAIESKGEVFAAIADCASLEATGSDVLAALRDGRLGRPKQPFRGIAVVDGNLPVEVIEDMVTKGDLSAARTYFVPASPGKAARLASALNAASATLVVNRIEAEILCETRFATSAEAARALAGMGADAIVTDSAAPAALIRNGTLTQAQPPVVAARNLTGAGDAFLAGFIAAECRGKTAEACLDAAVQAATAHVTRH